MLPTSGHLGIYDALFFQGIHVFLNALLTFRNDIPPQNDESAIVRRSPLVAFQHETANRFAQTFGVTLAGRRCRHLFAIAAQSADEAG